MYIHSWMVCHRPQSEAKSQSRSQSKSQSMSQETHTHYGDRSSGGQRPTSVKNAA